MPRCRNYWCYSAGTAIDWACAATRTDDLWQVESAAHHLGRLGRRNMLGVGDDCPIQLSAAKAQAVPGVISSIDPPCGPRASDRQRAARATSVDFLEPRRGRRGVCHFCRIGSFPLPRELPCKLVALFDWATRKEYVMVSLTVEHINKS